MQWKMFHLSEMKVLTDRLEHGMFDNDYQWLDNECFIESINDWLKIRVSKQVQTKTNEWESSEWVENKYAKEGKRDSSTVEFNIRKIVASFPKWR